MHPYDYERDTSLPVMSPTDETWLRAIEHGHPVSYRLIATDPTPPVESWTFPFTCGLFVGAMAMAIVVLVFA